MKANKAPKTATLDIGINDKDRAAIAKGLSGLLADSYTLYLMTHNFHWNVTGPQFNSLHLMFMGQYTEQWNALDLIAERIRSLGHPAPGTYKEFVKLASIKEIDGQPKARIRSAMISSAFHCSVYCPMNIRCRLLNCGPVTFQWKLCVIR